MSKFGVCQGYTGEPCVKCGRYRVEKFSVGLTKCEKCDWCKELNRYITDSEFYNDEDDYWVVGGENEDKR